MDMSSLPRLEVAIEPLWSTFTDTQNNFRLPPSVFKCPEECFTRKEKVTHYSEVVSVIWVVCCLNYVLFRLQQHFILMLCMEILLTFHHFILYHSPKQPQPESLNFIHNDFVNKTSASLNELSILGAGSQRPCKQAVSHLIHTIPGQGVTYVSLLRFFPTVLVPTKWSVMLFGWLVTRTVLLEYYSHAMNLQQVVIWRIVKTEICREWISIYKGCYLIYFSTKKQV